MRQLGIIAAILAALVAAPAARAQFGGFPWGVKPPVPAKKPASPAPKPVAPDNDKLILSGGGVQWTLRSPYTGSTSYKMNDVYMEGRGKDATKQAKEAWFEAEAKSAAAFKQAADKVLVPPPPPSKVVVTEHHHHHHKDKVMEHHYHHHPVVVAPPPPQPKLPSWYDTTKSSAPAWSGSYWYFYHNYSYYRWYPYYGYHPYGRWMPYAWW